MTRLFTFVAIFLPFLAIQAVADNLNNRPLVVNETEAAYTFVSSYTPDRVSIEIEADVLNYRNSEPLLEIFICDGPYRYLYLSGQFPASIFKVRGNTLSITASDLREFIVRPDFYFEAVGYSGPIPINVTISATSDLKIHEIYDSRWHTTQIDEPTVNGRLRENSTLYSGSITGNVAGYDLPMASSDPNALSGASLLQTNYRGSRFRGDLVTSAILARARIKIESNSYKSCRYYFSDSSKMLSVSATIPKDAKPDALAFLRVEIWRPLGQPALLAQGSVPISIFTVTGNNIVVNVPNLRDFVGDAFQLQETGYPGPIPVVIAVTATSEGQDKLIRTTTERQVQPDGSTLITTSREGEIDMSATARGEVADFIVPVSSSSPAAFSFAHIDHGYSRTRIR